MKNLLIALSLLLPGAAAAGVSAELAGARPDDVQAIREHIDGIFQAYIRKDRETLRRTHAEDWRGFLRPSTTIARGIDRYMELADRALSRPLGIRDYRFLEFDVVFYGDTAVVPYVAELELGVPMPFKPVLRVLDVYARMDGAWNQVASSVSSHPDTLAAGRQLPFPVTPARRREILEAREAVWRAWFANDEVELGRLLPRETLAIDAVEEAWARRDEILVMAGQFAASGGKLVRLEFPRTEIQLYGDVAILYTTYELELAVAGERSIQSGRGTEIFVQRDGTWVNPGWHLDEGPAGRRDVAGAGGR